MKRDMDLVREILIGFDEDKIDDSVFDDRELYHIEMLLDQNYVDGVQVLRGVDGHLSYGLFSPRLTWNGHEFADSIRSKTVSDKIKKYVHDGRVASTIDAIKLAAPTVVGTMLGKS